MIDVSVADELSQSFVSYALSTIVARALPDIRDGLKPVHRRVLYAMEQSKMWPSSSYRKSAQVVGATMARFHPHGDTAIYDTLVRLAQPFSLRLPLVDGHGNFGSLDDGPAASRYCVVGSTRIVDSSGRARRIDDMVGPVPDCDVELDVVVRGRRGEPVVASRGFHSGVHDILKVTSGAGFTVAGSHNHLVLCLLPVFGVPVLQWLRLDELVPGMHVAVARPQVADVVDALPDVEACAAAVELLSSMSMPEWVWAGDWSVKRGVVTGLFARSGTLLPTVDFVSDETASSVAEMLSHLGVVAWRGQSDVGVSLTVADAVSLARLAQLCGCPVPAAVPLSLTVDVVPYLAEFLADEYGVDEQVACELAAYVVSSAGDGGDSDDVDEREWDQVAAPLRPDMFFDVVESVEVCPPEAVFSLRVDTDEHAFLAAGFVNHNTECRLDPAGKALLDDLHEETVAWAPTYDNSELEPVVLPASFPNLLVNGAQGIAVGFSCSIPSHNLDEVVNALVHAVGNPKASSSDLRAFIGGPDFPTGGEVVDVGALDAVYSTGRGTFKLRARAEVVDVSARKKAVVVTELPYQVGPERVVAEVRDLVRDKRLAGLAEVRDLSDRKSGLRLVFDVKSGADADALCAELFARTSLETTVACSFVVLDGGRPVQADLARLCHAYVDHRRDVVRRRSQYRLDRTERRIHLLEGLIRALDAIDEVVAIIRSASDDATARTELMGHPALLLTEAQAEHVLDLQLRRLTRLSSTKLASDLASANTAAKKLRAILGSRRKLDEVVVDELKSTSAAFMSPRRTGLGLSWVPSPSVPVDSSGQVPAVASVPCKLAWTVDGGHLVHVGAGARVAKSFIDTSEGADLWVVSSSGMVYVVDTLVAVADQGVVQKGGPTVAVAAKGVPRLEAVAGLGSGERVVAVLVPGSNEPLGVVSKLGVVKRVAVDQLRVRGSQWSLMSLDAGDEVVAAGWAPDGTDFVLVSNRASLLRTPASKVRPQGRPAGGVAGLKLADGDVVVAAGVVSSDALVVCAAPSGRVKATAVGEFPSQGRGGAGVRSMRFVGGDETLAWAQVAAGRVVFGDGSDVPVGKRDGSGVPVAQGVCGLSDG